MVLESALLMVTLSFLIIKKKKNPQLRIQSDVRPTGRDSSPSSARQCIPAGRKGSTWARFSRSLNLPTWLLLSTMSPVSVQRLDPCAPHSTALGCNKNSLSRMPPRNRAARPPRATHSWAVRGDVEGCRLEALISVPRRHAS